jgi:uncharacterized protein YcbK (DUF882 family)
MYDPTPANVDSLEPGTRLRCIYLVNAARSAGVPLLVTSARRSYSEQVALVWQGKSKTFNSKHLQGRAFDVDVAGWDRDALPDSFWSVLWQYAEGLGLKVPLKSWDKGHFEL